MNHLENGKPEMLWRRVGIVFWSAAIGLGILRAWTLRFYMNPDGVSFLDMGDAFWRGDWSTAINAYWSPMYSWLTGLVLLVFRPSPYWEFPAIQALNLVVYIGVLACFGFFWREVFAWQKSRSDELSGQGTFVWPEWSWMLLGYSIAAWAGLRLIGIETTNSDMLLAGFVYLASGLVVRIRRGHASSSNFALLGLVLGLGYLAKSPMFPLAFVFLGVAMFSAGDWRRGVPRALLALAVFLLVGGPLVISLSLSRGHFTFGESGRVNFRMLYEGVGWRPAGGPNGMQGEHDEAPLPIAVAMLKGVTYLPFYDHTRLVQSAPVARNAAEAPHSSPWVTLGRYVRIWKDNARKYYDIFILRQGPLVAAILILFFLGPGWKSSLRGILQNWHVLIPACTALGAYGLLVVETRYVGPFIPVLWGGILPAIRLRDSAESKRLANSVTLVVAIVFAIQLFGYVGLDATREVSNPGHSQWEIAQDLQQRGLWPGDKVGVIARGQRAYWARLGRLSIVAEISPAEFGAFWWASPESRKRSLEAFAQTGAKAVVAEVDPRDAAPVGWQHRAEAEGWKKLGNTDDYVYLLSP